MKDVHNKQDISTLQDILLILIAGISRKQAVPAAAFCTVFLRVPA